MYSVCIQERLTFAVWSVGVKISFHPCIIWISKPTPVGFWDTEQTLYNLWKTSILWLLSETLWKSQTTTYILSAVCYFMSKVYKLNKCFKHSVKTTISHPHSPYPRLSTGVIQDGHGVWVRNSMAHQGRTEHPGQVQHIHPSICTLRHSEGGKKTVV